MRLALTFAAVLATAPLLAQTGVSGDWALTMRFPALDVTSTGDCTFERDGQDLAGWCGAPDRSVGFDVTGAIVDTAVTWRFVDPQGATMMTFDGVLEAGEIRGTCRVLAGEDCTFVLARP